MCGARNNRDNSFYLARKTANKSIINTENKTKIS